MPCWTLPPLFPDRRAWLYMLGLGGPRGRATIRRRALLDPGLSDAEFHERVTQVVKQAGGTAARTGTPRSEGC